MANLPDTVLVGFGTMNDSGIGVPPNDTYGGDGTIDENGVDQQNASNYGVLRIRSFGSYIASVPSRGIRKNGAHYILHWPRAGYKLQQSDNLTLWTDSNLPVEALSGDNTVSIPATAPRQFYRPAQ